MNKIPNYGNISEYLQKKDQIKKGMDNLKQEIASELGYDNVNIPNGKNLSSRVIGVYAGPVGGFMVQDLIKRGEEVLISQYQKDK